MIVTYTRDGSNATVSVNAAPKNPATPIPTYVVLAYASSFVPNPKSDPEPTTSGKVLLTATPPVKLITPLPV